MISKGEKNYIEDVDFIHNAIGFSRGSSIIIETNKIVFNIFFFYDSVAANNEGLKNEDIENCKYSHIGYSMGYDDENALIRYVKYFSNCSAMDILLKEYSNGIDADKGLVRLKEIYNI
ncbi:MAG: hypothetical protein JKY54_02840 [Flavobacteriales bacterium]|nr:hypothetical protein [Flavobacteriales bacterium]